MTTYAKEAMAINNAKSIIQKLTAKKIVRYAVYKERLMLFEVQMLTLKQKYVKLV